MIIAHLCPKCNGQGFVSKPPWVAGDVDVWTSTACTHTCDVCWGMKILYVQQEPDYQYQEYKKEEY
jgi:hypothetical protein